MGCGEEVCIVERGLTGREGSHGVRGVGRKVLVGRVKCHRRGGEAGSGEQRSWLFSTDTSLLQGWCFGASGYAALDAFQRLCAPSHPPTYRLPLCSINYSYFQPVNPLPPPTNRSLVNVTTAPFPPSPPSLPLLSSLCSFSS